MAAVVPPTAKRLRDVSPPMHDSNSHHDDTDDDDDEVLLGSDTTSDECDVDSCSTWSYSSSSSSSDSSDRHESNDTTGAITMAHARRRRRSLAAVCRRHAVSLRLVDNAGTTAPPVSCSTATTTTTIGHERHKQQQQQPMRCMCAQEQRPCLVVRVAAQWRLRLRCGRDGSPTVVTTAPLQLSCCLRESTSNSSGSNSSRNNVTDKQQQQSQHHCGACVVVGRALLRDCVDATPLTAWPMAAHTLHDRLLTRVSREHACVVLYYATAAAATMAYTVDAQSKATRAATSQAHDATLSTSTRACRLRSFDVVTGARGCSVGGVALPPHQRHHYTYTPPSSSSTAVSPTCVIGVDANADCELLLLHADATGDMVHTDTISEDKGSSRRRCKTTAPTPHATTAAAAVCVAPRTTRHDSRHTSSTMRSNVAGDDDAAAEHADDATTTLVVYTTGLVVSNATATACRRVGVLLNPPLRCALRARVLVTSSTAPLQRSVKLLTVLCAVEHVVDERWLRELLRRTAPHRTAAAAAHTPATPASICTNTTTVTTTTMTAATTTDDDNVAVAATRAVVLQLLSECAAYAHHERRVRGSLEAAHHFSLRSLLCVPPSARQSLLADHVVYVHPHTQPQQPPLNDVRSVLSAAGARLCTRVTRQTTVVVMPRHDCSAVCWRALAYGASDGDCDAADARDAYDVDDEDGAAAAAATQRRECLRRLLFVVVDDVFRCVLQQRPLQPPSTPMHWRVCALRCGAASATTSLSCTSQAALAVACAWRRWRHAAVAMRTAATCMTCPLHAHAASRRAVHMDAATAATAATAAATTTSATTTVAFDVDALPPLLRSEFDHAANTTALHYLVVRHARTRDVRTPQQATQHADATSSSPTAAADAVVQLCVLPTWVHEVCWRCAVCQSQWSARPRDRCDVQLSDAHGCPRCRAARRLPSQPHGQEEEEQQQQRASTQDTLRGDGRRGGGASLVRQYPALAAQWDAQRNAQLPSKVPIALTDVTTASSMCVWWTCALCHTPWREAVSSCVARYTRQQQQQQQQRRDSTLSANTHDALRPLLCAACEARGVAHDGAPDDTAATAAASRAHKRVLLDDVALMAEVRLRPHEDASAVSLYSEQLLHWQCCRCGYDYTASPAERFVRYVRCPQCSGAVCTPANALVVRRPDVVREVASGVASYTLQSLTVHAHTPLPFVCRTCMSLYRMPVRLRCSYDVGEVACPKCTLTLSNIVRAQNVADEEMAATTTTRRTAAIAAADRKKTRTSIGTNSSRRGTSTTAAAAAAIAATDDDAEATTATARTRLVTPQLQRSRRQCRMLCRMARRVSRASATRHRVSVVAKQLQQHDTQLCN